MDHGRLTASAGRAHRVSCEPSDLRPLLSIHPDVQKVLDARGEVSLSSMSVVDARAAHLAGATAGPVGPEMAESDDVELAGLSVRIHRPVDATGAGLVFFHGGGWVLGSIDTHDRQCRQLAAGSGATVFSVEYRLAPEHPFPAAFDDAVAVTTEILASAESFAVAPTRLGVGGDSAGANLAAGAALACRTLDIPDLRAQLLVYPALDAAMSSASFVENANAPFLGAAEMAWFYDLYQGEAKLEDWRLSPLRAADLGGLPPTLVVTAEYDPLRDEGEAFAHALATAGTPATSVRYLGVTHGFFGWSHIAEPSRQLMGQASGWLRSALA
jgi:acetyl esterase